MIRKCACIFPHSSFIICWGYRSVLIRSNSSVQLMVFKQQSPHRQKQAEWNLGFGHWCDLSAEVSYPWNRNLVEVSIYMLMKHQICSFFSQKFFRVALFLSPISEALRRLQKCMPPFHNCHSPPHFQHPVWCSCWPFLILKQKSQVLKFTGPEVFAEDLLNSLSPEISLSFSSAEGKAGPHCLLSAVCREQ